MLPRARGWVHAFLATETRLGWRALMGLALMPLAAAAVMAGVFGAAQCLRAAGNSDGCHGSFFDPSVKARVNCAAGADTASWRTAVTVALAHGDSR